MEDMFVDISDKIYHLTESLSAKGVKLNNHLC